MATITEDFVSFEVAELLKEKGFNERICHYYDEDGFLHCNTDLYFCNSLELNDYISAPTQQMAMKWLREVHNMYYEIQLLLGDKAEKYGDLQLIVYQLSISGAYVWKNWIYADTYVELYENYIKYCLENLV